jgi:hypothetical protein
MCVITIPMYSSSTSLTHYSTDARLSRLIGTGFALSRWVLKAWAPEISYFVDSSKSELAFRYECNSCLSSLSLRRICVYISFICSLRVSTSRVNLCIFISSGFESWSNRKLTLLDRSIGALLKSMVTFLRFIEQIPPSFELNCMCFGPVEFWSV